MSLIGQRLHDDGTPRYVKHPPASGATHLDDGEPVDAGSAHIISNNLSHLSAEGYRHWVNDLLEGTVKTTGRGYGGWDDIGGEPNSAEFLTTNPHAAIGWGRKNSRRYGPFFLVADRQLTDAGGYGPRTIRCSVDYSSGAASSLTLLAGLTSSPRPPSEGYVAFASATPAGAGRGQQTLNLTAAAWVENPGARPAWRCRPDADGARGATASYPPACWLWLGWYATNAADAVIALSAWEKP